MLPATHQTPVAPFRIRIEANGRGDARAVAAILADCLRQHGFHTQQAQAVPSLGARAVAERDAAVVTASRHSAQTEPLPHDRTDMLIVLDDELLDQPHILDGLNPNGTLLVATAQTPHGLRSRLGRHEATVATINNHTLAAMHGADWAAPVVGAVARLTGFVDPESLVPAVWTAYDRAFPPLAGACVRACGAGYHAVQF